MRKILTLFLILSLSIILSSCLDISNYSDKYDVKETNEFKYKLIHNNKTDTGERYGIGNVFSKKRLFLFHKKLIIYLLRF